MLITPWCSQWSEGCGLLADSQTWSNHPLGNTSQLCNIQASCWLFSLKVLYLFFTQLRGNGPKICEIRGTRWFKCWLEELVSSLWTLSRVGIKQFFDFWMNSSTEKVVSSHQYQCVAFATLLASEESSYLVDPASSHMLVSKIKPCMSKYKQVCTVKLRMAH